MKSTAQSSGTGAGSAGGMARNPSGMEPAEHDLLADLRRGAVRFGFRPWTSPRWRRAPTLGQRIADAVAAVMGLWTFIIIQSGILFANLVSAMKGLDPYPYILLNLALSFQAAYAAPVIMMSQNRQQAPIARQRRTTT